MKRQAGFTLIELVLVIVILGILAATAMPRFSNLSTEARVAALDGMRGGLQSAAAIARATQLARGIASNLPVMIENQSVDMAGGYPDATTTGIVRALATYDGFTTSGGGASIVFEKTGLGTGCAVTYNDSSSGAFPSITIASGSC